MYLAAGTSLDWALGVAEIPYTYTIELRDTGDYGILLPPSEIIPNHSAQEAEIPVESATTLDSRLYVWAFSTMH